VTDDSKEFTMSTEIPLPNLGENIEAADVVRVLVSVNQRIEVDDPLLELETGKVSMEVPSPIGGVVKQIYVEAGQSAAVGAIILTVDEGNGEVAVAIESEAVADDSQTTAVSGNGSPSPTTAAAAAPPETAGAAVPRLQASEGAGRSVAIGRPVPAAPAVRRFAREIGIDIAGVAGTGPAGRISADDVKAHAKALNAGRATVAAPGAASSATLPDFSKWGPIRTEPVSNVRRSTAVHVSGAWAAVPHVTQFDKTDITGLEAQRKRFAPKAEAAGGKLTVTAIILKVVAAALKKFPQFNASIDMANGTIITKDYYHIGVAVDTDRGLLVPVIRDVDRKNIIELSVELSQIAENTRNRKIALDEMQGGTFTVTNLGGIGGTAFTPIVNWPEAAILGVSRGSMEPVYRDGSFEPRLLLPLALSCDHRLIDGADGARFLRWTAEALENPFLLALEG